MVFTNLPNDVTLAPPSTSGKTQALLSAARNISGMTFEQAASVNSIYQGNGLICQQRMCQSMNGCEDISACQQNADYNKVLQFCGAIGTSGRAIDGGWWKLEPADSQQMMLEASQKATDMRQLPTSYNTTGMY